MRISDAVAILIVLSGTSACAGNHTQQRPSVAQPRGVGLAVNDELWVDRPQYTYDVELYETRRARGDLWMSPDVPAPQTADLRVHYPRLERFLSQVTPTRLASGAESQVLAF